MIIEVKGVNAEKLSTPDTGARATPDIADFSALFIYLLFVCLLLFLFVC